ncbi:phosphoglycerate dehydrogenase [Arachnia rubra]|uniref:D-3-phosphoglycerate dehydrogenase n=1 Tax=Arachnia rubra TaxID=1547448 RepID=A0ABX7Y240_9ACTN|nr:phosphoglycerate dehydrogenase [Arachnia rubra]MBB1578182.1 phosphoglycerate dehydrogenase [Propionibacterium sp.]QUC07008.1 phosphoglycerate dehydrogenase [Arachnia rubra]BCR81238.1 D-3-phosphoglycerate dehydrogenase [Arachnia rubra]
MKALLLENIHSEAVRALEGRGYQVELRSGALGEAELADALEGVELLGIRSRTHITGTVLKAHPQLLAVGAFCIGTNQIDLPAAAAAGVAVFNAPYSNTRSVVELALGEIITMARRLGDKNASMHAGIWDKSANGSHEVRGRTLGIVGYGNIGSQLSVLAEAMGMKVYFYDVVDRLALGNATRVDSMQELFETCETISLHVDGRASNARLIGEREFAQMRPRTLFLNLCRGNVVDVDALAAALQSGHIAGAAVDVFPDEPKSKDEPFVSPLQGISNVILTPHVGGSTLEAQVDIGRYVAGKLADYEAYGNTSMAVNLPEVSVPVPQAERILHLHRNVPGVLARLNHTLAGHNMNIGSQTLSTLGEYGYVVTDVSGQHYEGLLAELQALEESIRVRMI